MVGNVQRDEAVQILRYLALREVPILARIRDVVHELLEHEAFLRDPARHLIRAGAYRVLHRLARRELPDVFVHHRRLARVELREKLQHHRRRLLELHRYRVVHLVQRLVEALVFRLHAVIARRDAQQLPTERIHAREPVVRLGDVFHAERVAVVELLPGAHREGVACAVRANLPIRQHLREDVVVAVAPEELVVGVPPDGAGHDSAGGDGVYYLDRALRNVIERPAELGFAGVFVHRLELGPDFRHGGRLRARPGWSHRGHGGSRRRGLSRSGGNRRRRSRRRRRGLSRGRVRRRHRRLRLRRARASQRERQRQRERQPHRNRKSKSHLRASSLTLSPFAATPAPPPPIQEWRFSTND